MSLALARLIDLSATPAPRRRGRPRNSETPGKDELQAECALLMLRSKWPVKRIAASLGISRMTAYRWKAEWTERNGPEAQAVRDLARRSARRIDFPAD